MALGEICGNFVCAQCVSSSMGEWSMHCGDVWGLVPAEERLPSLCCRNCQECAALDSVVANKKGIHGILMKGSSYFFKNNSHSFIELGPFRDGERSRLFFG